MGFFLFYVYTKPIHIYIATLTYECNFPFSYPQLTSERAVQFYVTVPLRYSYTSAKAKSATKETEQFQRTLNVCYQYKLGRAGLRMDYWHSTGTAGCHLWGNLEQRFSNCKACFPRAVWDSWKWGTEGETHGEKLVWPTHQHDSYSSSSMSNFWVILSNLNTKIEYTHF